MTVIALLGDSFVTPDLLAHALRSRLPNLDHDLRSSLLPWPQMPYGPVAEVSEASGTEEEVIAAIGDAEICLTQMAPITRRVLEAVPGLRLLCVARGGPVNVNLEAAAEHGVEVRSAPGRNATATAEHTVALILAAARQIPRRHNELLRGDWRSDYYMLDQCGPEIGQSTVGLVGFGAVGARVADMVRAMGASLVVYDPHAASDAVREPDVRTESLEHLLSISDVVSLHARLTPETRDMIGAREIAAMRRGSILVNAARGPLLDYDAVCDALDSRHLFAAAFDVFATEPIPAGDRLLTTPNVILTPHLAGATQHTAMLAAEMCAIAVEDFLHASREVGAPRIR